MREELKVCGVAVLFLMCAGCDELSFFLQDSQASNIKSEELKTKRVNSFYTVYTSSPDSKDSSVLADQKATPENVHHIIEESTLLTEDMALTTNTVIRSKKVILNEVTVKTFHHDLRIITDEFISHNAVIQNFPEGQKAERNKHGRKGGHILIEAVTAEGQLQLILNGEQGGMALQRRLSKKDLLNLKGGKGAKGKNAVYRKLCHQESPQQWRMALLKIMKQNGYPEIPAFLIAPSLKEKYPCVEECVIPPTKGSDGEKGRSGLAGPDGKNGGHSGSFHLKAFNLSGFNLMSIVNNPGTGSEGGNGTPGGLGGKGGESGKDRKNICKFHMLRAKNGARGKSGSKGKRGKDGKKGKICLERLIPNYEMENPESNARGEGEIVCY